MYAKSKDENSFVSVLKWNFLQLFVQIIKYYFF